MVDQILVPFHGAGSGLEELSWGQQGIWRTITLSGRSVTLGDRMPVPPGFTVEHAVTILRYALSRHQSLRTRLRFEPGGRVLQQVFTSGEVPLEVVDVAATDDPAEVAEAVLARYEGADFDYVAEWPVRMAVIRHRGVVTHVVNVYLHTTMDAQGLQVLVDELPLLDYTTGVSTAPPPGMPPMDQACKQRTPHVQRQGEASIRHMERVMMAAPPRRFPEPAPGEPYYRMVSYRSPATLLASRAVALRDRVDTSPVLLAAFAVGMTRITDINPFVTMLAVSNRFRPGFANSVSTVAQVSPCLIDLADITMNEVVLRARRAAMSAYKSAYYPPARRMEVYETVARKRGQEIDMSCFLNDRRVDRDPPAGPEPSAAEIHGALPRGEFRWERDSRAMDETFYLEVDDRPECIEWSLSADIRHFPPAQMEALLRDFEAAAVQAAVEPTAPTGIRSAAVPV